MKKIIILVTFNIFADGDGGKPIESRLQVKCYLLFVYKYSLPMNSEVLFSDVFVTKQERLDDWKNFIKIKNKELQIFIEKKFFPPKMKKLIKILNDASKELQKINTIEEYNYEIFDAYQDCCEEVLPKFFSYAKYIKN
jgi:hypothetical protein